LAADERGSSTVEQTTTQQNSELAVTRSSVPRYAEVLDSLFARTTDAFKLGLDSPRMLLRALGNPEQKLKRVVLVAGTNGKGSTSALISGALQAAGLRVGFFSSPHLLQFCERIRVNGELVSPTEVTAMYKTIQEVEHRCQERPTFFECAMAMATMTFVDRDVDIAVYEIGLGGRLDATNVLDRDLAVITPIGFDHQKYLGNTLTEIAAEKAAILPHDKLAVVAPQKPEALEVIEQMASQRRCALVLTPEPSNSDGALIVDGETLTTRWFPPYQRTNIATAWNACRALEKFGLTRPIESFRRAVDNFSWPGRYQRLEQDGIDVIVDGAHNMPGVAAMCAAIDSDPKIGGRPIHCVFSALRDKAVQHMLAEIDKKTTSQHFTPVPSSRTLTLTELRKLARDRPVYNDVSAALVGARRAAAKDGGIVLVTGSLYLVGEAISLLTGAARDPAVNG